jgi:hypothetical protein
MIIIWPRRRPENKEIFNNLLMNNRSAIPKMKEGTRSGEVNRVIRTFFPRNSYRTNPTEAKVPIIRATPVAKEANFTLNNKDSINVFS